MDPVLMREVGDPSLQFVLRHVQDFDCGFSEPLSERIDKENVRPLVGG